MRVTLNYQDLAIANESYPFPVKDNVVPCSDSAGVVAAVGDAVEDISVGDRVMTNFDLSNLCGPQKDWAHSLDGFLDGMLRQYIAVPAVAVAKIPEACELSFTQLASLVCTGITAWNTLFGCILLQLDQTVLFLDTGGVSITALQLAKAAGAVTIITSSSDEKLHEGQLWCESCVINYRKTPDWAAEINRITDGRGADYIVENGGAGTIAQSIKACVCGGMIAVIGFLTSVKQEDMPNVASMAPDKGCIVRGVVVGSKQLLGDVIRFVSNKNVQPYIHETFGFSCEGTREAFDHLKAARHTGKIGIEVASKK
uniref:Enoyl reductase (ER) domain-containing protein n=1 Tax=Globisporangium ultimum (strain ATCC 200006 / CBS 805.95 / DAOM BR144) TaxID=431595 RepID=K3X7J7_GLOUD